MSKTTIIIIAVVALIIIIVMYSMYKSAQAKAAAAQQAALYGSTRTSSQKVNVADIGNFVGGLITGLKTNQDQQTASATA